MDAKYTTTASGEPILSSVTLWTIRLSVVSSVYRYVGQSKGRDITFHLSEKKNMSKR